MKKLTWIAALLIALALLVIGCPGGGDPIPEGDDGDNTAKNLFLSTTEGGTAVHGGNTFTTTQANQNLYVYFDPPGRDFTKIVFNFTLDPGDNFTITALYGTYGGDICTWGKQTWDTDWFESGPIDIISADFTADWSHTDADGIIKSTIFGFCVNIAQEDITFTVTGVTFEGLVAAADKTELIDLIEQAEIDIVPNETEYTSASWSEFAAALDHAKTIAGKSNATVQEVANAIAGLYEAYENLVPAVAANKVALNALIAEAEALDEAIYTLDSWSDLTQALNNARSVSAASNSTQSKVNDAEDWLQNAMDGLQLIQEIDLPDSFWTIDDENDGSVTATLVISEYVAFDNDVITVEPNPNALGEFRVWLYFDPPVDVSSVQGVMFATDGVEASFNITYKSASDVAANNWGSSSGAWGLWGDILEDEWGAYVGKTDQTVAFIELYSSAAFTSQNSVEIAGFNFQVGEVYDPGEGGGDEPYDDPEWSTDSPPVLGDIIHFTGVSITGNKSPATLGKKNNVSALRVDRNTADGIKVQFALSPSVDISSKTKFTMTFIGTQGFENLTFNISPYFTTSTGWGCILTKSRASPIDFVFGTDEPTNWGNGPISESSKVLTGFEIYVDSTTAPVLYVTDFSVE